MKFFTKKLELSLFNAIVLSAFFFVITQNLAFWRAVFELISFESSRDYLFIVLLLALLMSLMVIFFTLILWSRLTYPTLVVLLALSTVFNYFSFHYRIYMDREMLINIVETNTFEVLDLMSYELGVWVIVSTLIPTVLLMRIRIKPTKVWKNGLQRFLLIVCSCAIIYGIAAGFYKDFASFFRNNRQVVKLIMPSSFFQSSLSYARKSYSLQLPFIQVGEDAILTKPERQKKTLMVILVGETARSQNFSLNGYGNETNPLLQQQENLVSFQDVASCGTATAVSVPCLFSKLTRQEFDKITVENQDNVMDILQRVGYKVLWRENDNGCKGVCNRIPTQDVGSYIDAKPTPSGFYYDEYLLTELDDYIQAQGDENLVIVLHMNGSHGPTYYQRYPDAFKKFTPNCDTNRIETCATEALINTYDNTILYTDYVLNNTIELLKNFSDEYETAMLYISDHGESLGEKGLYLHGTPYAIAPTEQTAIPLIFWGSNEFYQARNIQLSCVQQRAKLMNYSHDNIFHTLLGLLSVTTKEYQSELNIFDECYI